MVVAGELGKDRIFVIIVTYNGMKWLAECLNSCMDYPIVIVDNGSDDDTVAYIKNNYPQTHLLAQEKNLGFGQANNLGISHALTQGADYVFLLNQDAYLQEGCLETLLEVQKGNPQYGILSPIHLNGKGNRLDQNFSNYVSYKNNPDFYSDFVLKKPLQAIYGVPFVNAAGWLLSRDILETVGGFDPIFFHYGEDDNYCQRARYHDFKIGVVPNAFLFHDREDREKVSPNPVDYFINRERGLKDKYANINVDNVGELEKLLRKRKRALVKLFLRLRFSKLPAARQELHIVEKVLQEVYFSRNTNQVKDKHYLE